MNTCREEGNQRKNPRLARFRAGLGVCALVAALAALSLGPHAADTNGKAEKTGRVGFVDIQRIFTEAEFVRTLLDELDSEVDSQRQAIETKQKEYAQLVDELKRQDAVLSESEQAEKRARSRRLLLEIEDDTDALNRSLRKSKKERTDPALKRIEEAIGEVARQEGYDLVLDGELVMYGNPTVNVSSQVIEHLNRTIKPAADPKGKAPAVAK